eukprot:2475223-Rhodomonas_salina.2
MSGTDLAYAGTRLLPLRSLPPRSSPLASVPRWTPPTEVPYPPTLSLRNVRYWLSGADGMSGTGTAS